MHTITTIAQLVDFGHQVQSKSGLRCWYRGHSKASYKLQPSAHRNYTEEQERNLTTEFRARAATRHIKVPHKDDYAAWLALAQHYGLPTRLLDWTFSPLIAAFFAVDSANQPPDEDACIWALLPSELNKRYGYEPYLFPLDANSFHDLLEPAFKTRESPQKIAAAMAIEADTRMQMQQGAFTIHSFRTPLCQHLDTEDWLFRAIIPAASIADLRYELKVLSIRKDSVFPDLTALAKQLVADIGP